MQNQTAMLIRYQIRDRVHDWINTVEVFRGNNRNSYGIKKASFAEIGNQLQTEKVESRDT